MNDSNITNLDDMRKKSVQVCMLTAPPPPPRPDGPFTVSVKDQTGTMFEVIFPDYTGILPRDANILSSHFDGASEVLCNLLTGAMRVYLGADDGPHADSKGTDA